MQAAKRVKLNRMASEIKPILMWIDGNCFNIANKSNKKKGKPLETNETKNFKDEEKFNISSLETGTFSSTFRLPSWYYAKLHAHNNFSIDELAKTTGTTIDVPKNGKNGHIGITGANIQNVIDARHEVQATVSDIRDRATALQFISIPVLSEDIKKKFMQFKNEILEGEAIVGMDPSIFQSELKLHLTICVFSLMDDTEKREAINALYDYKAAIFDSLLKKTGPLKIKVAGIDCMNDNHNKVNVLYAKASLVEEVENTSLQTLANDLSNYFYERGLLRRYIDNVKLHVTLINTKYRKSSVNNTPKKRRWADARMTFNASNIMEKYKDFAFGEATLDQIHLSNISSKGDDGYYVPLAIIKA